MNRCYRVIFVSSVCLLLAVPMMAAEIARVEILEESLRPLGGSAPFACCETSVYENITGSLFALAATPRWNMMDDGAFPAGTAPVDVYCFRVGFDQAVAERLILVMDFWDTVVPAGPVCNLTYIGGIALDFGTIAVGGWWYEHVLSTPITFPDDDWCVQMSFYQSYDPLVPSTNASVLFADGGPTVGSNDANVFYYDVDESGSFECPGEAASFGGSDDQFYLRLGTGLMPSATEPTNWGAIKALYR